MYPFVIRFTSSHHTRLRIAAVVLLCLLSLYAAAQQNTPGAGNGSEKKSYPPGNAWTLSSPLGDHVESTIDTTLYNYQRGFVTAMTTDAWASTGQLSGPGIDMLWFDRQSDRLPFYFARPIERWVPDFAKEKFYNVYIPMTLLSYNLTFGNTAKTDWLNAIFAGNVNRKLGFGAKFNFPYTKGQYDRQAAKELAFGFQGYYRGDRYEMQAFYNHYNHVNQENGGITDDLYITDPAAVQGGVNSIDPRSIPVNLAGATNRVIGTEAYMSHAFKLGYYNDITQPTDTLPKYEYVPVTKFVYAFDYKDGKRVFVNNSAPRTEDYWPGSFFMNDRSNDEYSYWSVSNTLGVELLEGFRKWAKFGLSAFATYEIDHHASIAEGADELYSGDTPPSEGLLETEGLLPLPEGVSINPSATRHRVWVGGRLNKTRGSIIRYDASARFGLVGDVAGELDLVGKIGTKFRLAKDTVAINAEASFRNLEPNYFFRHYVGNHYAWSNPSFGKTRSLRIGGSLTIPWTWTTLGVNMENLQNHVYLDSSNTPRQFSGNIQILSASIQQDLHFGIWNWNNRLTWQTSSEQGILPLPMLTLYSNMYLYFHAFKALTVQFGIDCNYYTAYNAPFYQPATMTFRLQGDDAVKVGNYPLANVYLTCKLYKVRFFAMCAHVNEGWFSKNYFALPHYPIDPLEFRFGLSIDFAN